MVILFFGTIIFIADMIYFWAITELENQQEVKAVRKARKHKAELLDLPLFMSARIQWQDRLIEVLLWLLGGLVVILLGLIVLFFIVR